MASKSEEKKMKKSKRKAEGFVLEGSPPKKRREEPSVVRQSATSSTSQTKQTKIETTPADKKRSKKKQPKTVVDAEPDEEDSHVRGILLKYQKATKLASEKKPEVRTEPEEEKTQTHGIVPLPQPNQPEEGPYRPGFSTLPKSFQQPLVTPSSRITPFKDLPISPELVGVLSSKGYEDAFAVQAAVLPLLLAGDKQHSGDVCVSASTGSGKTLAYVLPMVDSMRDRAITALRGLIIVPTRELAVQVAEVCRMCASGTKLNVEIALGNRPIKVERDVLVGRTERCDPAAFRNLWQNDTKRLDQEMWENFEDFRQTYLKQDTVYDFYSKIDILICTPGRLVEHLQTTKGFSLAHLEWLVVDEADRLLDQSFQGWLNIVSDHLEAALGNDVSDSAKLIRSMGISLRPRTVRKVVLSATLTRDTGKISSLRLRDAKLVVVRDDGTIGELSNLDTSDGPDGPVQGERVDIYNLPALLREQAVAAGDGAYKPLYLLKLLKQHVFLGVAFERRVKSKEASMSDTDMSSDSSESDTESDSDSEEESESDDSDSSSDSGSTSTSLSSDNSDSSLSLDGSSSSSSGKSSTADVEMEDAPDIQVARPAGDRASELPTVLIFTRSNESTLRLSRLLELLDSAYSSRIGVLTSSVRRSQRKKTLVQFLRGNLNILIASDLVSRGLDLPNLSHVINYDPPNSVTEYVHRCGRTARAGKSGSAFTLLADREARWFWNNIARSEEIRRPHGAKVARLKIEFDHEAEAGALEKALETLETEVKSR